jgi:hypothetical protein
MFADDPASDSRVGVTHVTKPGRLGELGRCPLAIGNSPWSVHRETRRAGDIDLSSIDPIA